MCPSRISKKSNGVPRALLGEAIRPFPVMALVAEMHGARSETAPDWRYNAFELLF
jgi:hypothetical protein